MKIIRAQSLLKREKENCLSPNMPTICNLTCTPTDVKRGNNISPSHTGNETRKEPSC